MINVEFIYPYTIVEENDKYGIIDNTGKFVVPCVMDEIVNTKDDEIGLELWNDFFCVLVVKDGKNGFFTSNGKFIEPVYDTFTVDCCGGDIHVKTEKGYGVLASPEYTFEEIPFECSLLSEIYPEDSEDLDEDTLEYS